MKRLAMILAVAAVVPFATATAWADWIDSFGGDTAEQTWTVGGSGTATVTNNRYELSTTVSGTTDQAILPYVDTESAADCILEGRVQQIESGDNFLAYLAGRVDPTNGNAYVCGVSTGDPHLWLGKLVAGSYETLTSLGDQPSFNPADCQVKFSLIGSTLRGKVWSTGDAEPDDWQIEGADSDYASGYGGVMAATYHPLGWDNVRVAFDDVSMTTIPEPGTVIALLSMGLMLGLAILYRRRRNGR